MERKRIAAHTKGIGKPKVGGPFNLVDQNGRSFTHEDLKDKYALVCDLTWSGVRCGSERLTMFLRRRYTSDSVIVQTYVLMSSTKWPR
jgi:hypothetical protein